MVEGGRHQGTNVLTLGWGGGRRGQTSRYQCSDFRVGGGGGGGMGSKHKCTNILTCGGGGGGVEIKVPMS